MKGPSKKWKQIRQASLEAAHRHTFGHAQYAYDLYFAVYCIYMVGYIRFNFFEYLPVGSSLIEALQIGITGVAMVLIAVLTQAVLVIIFLEWRSLRYAGIL